MSDVFKRIEHFPPERRRLIERLLEKEGIKVRTRRSGRSDTAPEVDARDNVADVGHVPEDDLSGDDRGGDPTVHPHMATDEKKADMYRFYNSISQQLDSSMFGASSYFLNLGYVANENRQYSSIQLPDHMFDKNSAKLVLETIGDVDLTGAEVLDVGCGRGGTIFVLKTYFDIKKAVGMDISSAAIAFCHREHGSDNVRFLHGDAENLDFDDGSFDVVTNIESAQSYPNIFSFYSEVDRVLRPGGCLLYADCFRQRERIDVCLRRLRQLGFTVERNQDITKNVLLSCDEIGARRLRAFGRSREPDLMRHFLSAPGSMPYECMKHGDSEFRIFRLRKA